MQSIFGGAQQAAGAVSGVAGGSSGQTATSTGGQSGGSSAPITSAGIEANQQPVPAQTQSGGMQNYGFGPGAGTINPGQVLPNSAASGDVPLLPPNPGANEQVRNSFLPQNLTAPFYNLAGVAGNLGTAAGQSVQGASNFLQGAFDPNLNQFEQASLAAGNANASKLLEQSLVRAEGQSENSPYHGAIGQVQGEVANQYARDALQQAGNMGIQREQLAAGLANTPFNQTLQAAQVGPSTAERLFNLGNAQQQAALQEPEAIYSQIPLASQTLIPPAQQTSGGFKF